MLNLRAIGTALREATTCPICGKSQMVFATAHRGHGTGQREAAYYEATAHEAVTADTHCTCPGGPASILDPARESGE